MRMGVGGLCSKMVKLVRMPLSAFFIENLIKFAKKEKFKKTGKGWRKAQKHPKGGILSTRFGGGVGGGLSIFCWILNGGRGNFTFFFHNGGDSRHS